MLIRLCQRRLLGGQVDDGDENGVGQAGQAGDDGDPSQIRRDAAPQQTRRCASWADGMSEAAKSQAGDRSRMATRDSTAVVPRSRNWRGPRPLRERSGPGIVTLLGLDEGLSGLGRRLLLPQVRTSRRPGVQNPGPGLPTRADRAVHRAPGRGALWWQDRRRRTTRPRRSCLRTNCPRPGRTATSATNFTALTTCVPGAGSVID